VNVAVLEVAGLSVTFPTRDGEVRAVRDLSLSLERGETIGIVGESGSGKSTIALAVLGLLPRGARVTGSVRVDGRELLGLTETELAKVRGGTIAYIPQDPLTSLNPAFPVGWQVAETLWTRGLTSKAAALEKAIALLDTVGIPRAARRADDYPHEFSGGMRQRVVIAIAMACDPDVIIADEPTTALDVTIQAQVLDALRAARDQTGASPLLITHDLGVVAGMADRVMVMYAGKAVESGPADAVFYDSEMPYTLGLLGSLPRLDPGSGPRASLRPIPGSPPSLIGLPAGCPFAPRCPAVVAECLETEPVLSPVEPGHSAACHRAGSLPPDLFAAPADAGPADRPAGGDSAAAGASEEIASEKIALVQVRDLVKHFPIRGGRVVRHQVATAHAVDGVSFELAGGETLGLVGESGCGKSTTARTVLQLLPVTSGSVRYAGTELTGKSRREMRPYRQHLQVVFQDPFASLSGPRPEGPGARRAGVRARRVHPGGHRQPAGGPAGPARARVPVYRPRPVGGAAHLRPGRRHVPGADRGIGHGAVGLRAPRAPVHAGAAVRRPRRGSRRRARPSADPARRRRAERRGPAVRLPVPHPLLEGPGHLRHAAAGADRARPGPPGRLPLRRRRRGPAAHQRPLRD
jgi:peptide/nickel transport system ATP-binding protein